MTREFTNHYSTLGVNSSATADEIRRAYRVLARRYHPDLNPGQTSEDRFKNIAEAYDILSDPQKRKQFDTELEQHLRRLGGTGSSIYDAQGRPRAHSGGPKSNQTGANKRKSAAQRFAESTEQRNQREESQRGPEPTGNTLKSKPALNAPSTLERTLTNLGRSIRAAFAAGSSKSTNQAGNLRDGIKNAVGGASVERISVIEVSLSMRDAIFGVKKTVEIAEPEGIRKISVSIPPGVRSGSVVRLRGRKEPIEEVVLIVRLASHPLLSIQPKGLTLEVPITINEAIFGASITVPTLDEPLSVRVNPGTQSGSELRLKGKGIVGRAEERGDLFLRFIVKVPESPEAVGLRDKAGALDQYYETSVRQGLPASLAEISA